MKILTNARHWKQNAFGVVEISYNQEKDLVRAKLIFITKYQSHAAALANTPSMNYFIVVPTNATCSTPEQIIDSAVKIWQTARQTSKNAIQ